MEKKDLLANYAASKQNMCITNDTISDGLFQEYGVNRGLRDVNGKGVLTGLTRISKIVSFKDENGKQVPCDGELWYRGYNVKTLIKSIGPNEFGFEKAAYLLLFGELPDQAQLDEFCEMLGNSRTLPTNFTRDVIMKAPSKDIMNSMTRSILTLAAYDPYTTDSSIENNIRQCMQLIANFPMIAVYGYHAYNHYENDSSMYIHRPDPKLSTAENFLRMLRPNKQYTQLEAQVLDVALMLHMEHGGGNNSTFTTRVVTSAGTDTYSAIAAAMSSLKGPKHGGANIKVMQMMNDIRDRKTPLQVSLDQFSRKLAVLVMGISAVVLGLCLYRKMPLLDALMFAVALAVAAIPEALSSIVTIVQAMGTQKMVKENAIVRKLKAVESLGCVSVICSDKTGTLTQNKMTVQKVYVDDREYLPEQLSMEEQLHRYLVYDAVLSNDATLENGKGIGDPTEYALLEMFRKIPAPKGGMMGEGGYREEMLRSCMKRLEEVPFDSERKRMSTRYYLHGVGTILTKGAPDVLLERCEFVRKSTGIFPLDPTEAEKIKKKIAEFSGQGLRVLAFAYKESEGPLTIESEENLIFLGLIAMMDPPRPEAIQAVADAKRAGIRTVMITGDHKITARAIAKQLGIYQEGDLAVTGRELDAMSEKELQEKLEKICVYARVSPEHKIRIVKAWQKKGRIVSMTGDGVNDAPALKCADIGVAMGITGTEVAKDAADMILLDDNFATIIQAVVNGRNVYRNIKNAILFLLSGNMAAILAVLYTSLAGLPVPFAPVHLLFINLLTDSLPAIAIGMEPADAALLEEKPRDPSAGILTGSFLGKIVAEGALIACPVMTSYYIGLQQSTALAATMAFATLTLARLFHGFNCRSKKSMARVGLGSNKYSMGAFLGGCILLGLVLCVPVFERLFDVAEMGVLMYGYILLLAFVPTLVIQMVKMVREKMQEGL